MKKIEMYTSDTCPNCTKLKEYLNQNNIEYIEYNISKKQMLFSLYSNKQGLFGNSVSSAISPQESLLFVHLHQISQA